MNATITLRGIQRARVLAPLAIALALATGSAVASQLVYTPVNPSFGGNPLNGTYLLNKAQAENSHQPPMPNVGDLLGQMGLSPDLAGNGGLGSASTTITIGGLQPGNSFSGKVQ